MKELSRIMMATAVTFVAALPVQAAEKLTLDDKHTYVAWHIDHLGFSQQMGKWYAKGSIVFDPARPDKSSVKATIDVAKFVTGIPELDKHLNGELFFNTAKYPQATFVSDKVSMMTPTSAKVFGTLSLRGVVKPNVELRVNLVKTGKNPMTDQITYGFSATTIINRSDFGIKTLIPALGDKVTIEIAAEAFVAKP